MHVEMAACRFDMRFAAVQTWATFAGRTAEIALGVIHYQRTHPQKTGTIYSSSLPSFPLGPQSENSEFAVPTLLVTSATSDYAIFKQSKYLRQHSPKSCLSSI